MARTTAEANNINIKPLRQGIVKLRIVGTMPLFQNKMSAKVKQGLLVGSHKKTAAEKREIKHDPLTEFRNSAEQVIGGPTALGLLTVSIKRAMCDAAIETEGVKKTTAQRLLFIPGEHAALYGTPYLRMDVTRSADIARTPDIRTRAFLPKWGCELEIRYCMPQLNLSSTINLLANAGAIIGVGDFRQQKGAGGYGLFRVIGDSTQDAEWDDLVANHGREAQERALKNPEFAGPDTEELMDFFYAESRRRAA